MKVLKKNMNGLQLEAAITHNLTAMFKCKILCLWRIESLALNSAERFTTQSCNQAQFPAMFKCRILHFSG